MELVFKMLSLGEIQPGGMKVLGLSSCLLNGRTVSFISSTPLSFLSSHILDFFLLGKYALLDNKKWGLTELIRQDANNLTLNQLQIECVLKWWDSFYILWIIQWCDMAWSNGLISKSHTAKLFRNSFQRHSYFFKSFF